MEGLSAAHVIGIFGLVTLRNAAAAVVMPVPGSYFQSIRFRVTGVLLFSLIVTLAILDPNRVLPSLSAWPRWVGGELTIGLAFGLGVRSLFLGLQVAGDVLERISGLSLSVSYGADPSTRGTLSRFVTFFVLGAFLLAGGHRIVVEQYLNGFRLVPPGSAGEWDAIGSGLTALAAGFGLGVQAALPLMVAVGIGAALSALLARLAPAFQALASSSGLGPWVLLTTLFVVVGVLATSLPTRMMDRFQRTSIFDAIAAGAGEIP